MSAAGLFSPASAGSCSLRHVSASASAAVPAMVVASRSSGSACMPLFAKAAMAAEGVSCRTDRSSAGFCKTLEEGPKAAACSNGGLRSAFFGDTCGGFQQSRPAADRRLAVHWLQNGGGPKAVFQWAKKPEFKGTMPRVIVVTSGKGGVGKTTITANLGMSLARLEFKVVAIDCDVGLRNLDLLLGLEARVLYTVQDVINGEARLDQALIRDKRCPNFELLCISKPRSKVDLTFSGKSLLLLVESLRDREEGCPHFILLDCPAGIEAGFITAITPANEAIIVTTPDVTCLRDADRVAGLLECDGITDVKLLINRVRSDLIKAGQMMSVSDVREMLGLPLLGVIPEDAAMIGASNEGMPLVLKKPPAMAGLAVEAAAWRLISGEEMNTVLLPEEKKKSFGIF